MNRPAEKNRLLTVKQAAEFLGYSPATLRSLMCRRQISFLRIKHRGQIGEGSPRFRLSDLEAMVERVPTLAEVREGLGK